MKVCVVIPAYNEEKRISKTLDDFSDILIKKYRKDINILVISDGSTDRTNEIVNEYSKKYPQIKLFVHAVREGKGSGVTRGFEIACRDFNPDIIGFVDADPSVSGTEIIKLVDRLKDKNVEGVIASRYIKGSKLIGDLGKTRFVASRGYNLLIRLLFGLKFKDTQCGAKFFRSSAICSILDQLKLTDMSFDINLLYEMKRRKYNIEEVPITYKVILEGTKVNVRKQIPKMFIVTFSYRITRSPLNAVIPEKLKRSVYERVKKW